MLLVLPTSKLNSLPTRSFRIIPPIQVGIYRRLPESFHVCPQNVGREKGHNLTLPSCKRALRHRPTILQTGRAFT